MKYACKGSFISNSLFFIKKTLHLQIQPTTGKRRQRLMLERSQGVKFRRAWKNMKVMEKSDTKEKRWNGKGHDTR